MSTAFAWGLVGPGRIAHQFADALRGVEGGARLVAVQGRDISRAAAFAERWGAAHATDSLAELLANPAVQGVYVATPHAFHAGAVRACLEAGKPVLCEKPLVTDAATAGALSRLAHERGVFLMEALWTRFLPLYAQVAHWLQQGAIGRLRALQSSFCFNTPFDPRSRAYDPAQAGGALLDIGIYNLAVTRWVLAQSFGACPLLQGLDVHAVMAPSGTDQRLSAMLDFGGGLASQFVCGFDGEAENRFHILGEKGSISIERNFWGASEAWLQRQGAEPQRASAPLAVNGFEYEVTEAQRCIAAGRLESPGMPHAETIATLEWMDIIRERIGLRYPFEAE
jgi:predicted dehydrogenase